jgi:hypothetical protein
MAISQCILEWGRSTIVRSAPAISTHENAIYVPFNVDLHWGLFDQAGAMIEDAIDYRGPEKNLNQQVKYAIDIKRLFYTPPRSFTYIYGGRFHLHYGHLLINTLSRLWPLHSYQRSSLKIVIHSAYTVEQIFSHQTISSILGALELGPENFYIPTEPVAIEEIIVPATSFAEQNFAHDDYRQLCHRIGHRFAPTPRLNRYTQPIYLTKEFLPAGVGRIVNESIISDIFQKNGIEIIAPERLSFNEQLSLFGGPATIIGTATSAMHTSIFSGEASTIICINPTLGINTNFIMIDKLARNRTIYLYDSDTVLVDGENFLTSRKLVNPKNIASLVLSLLRTI